MAMAIDFTRRIQNIREIFLLLSRVPTGARILEAFLPLFHAGKVIFLPYPEEVRIKLVAITGPDQPIGACFENDGITGRIAYDPQAPLGVLAPYLLHEMVHATDAHLWGPAARDHSSRQQTAQRAEIKAFETQFQLLVELRERFSHYDHFLKSQYPKALYLHQKLEQELLSEIYGFSPQTAKRKII